MKLTYFQKNSFFPFPVPIVDGSTPTGAGTPYPCGFSLDQVMQLYWRAQSYLLNANGAGVFNNPPGYPGHTKSQTLTISSAAVQRNAQSYGTGTGFNVTPAAIPAGFAPTCPGELVTGRSVAQTVTGSGTLTVSGGEPGSGTAPAVFNLEVYLFYPGESNPVDIPLVRYAGLWWPSMSIFCNVTNGITPSSGPYYREGFTYACGSMPSDPAATYNLGAFNFFGQSIPIYCDPLATGETRSFSGSIAVNGEWP